MSTALTLRRGRQPARVTALPSPQQRGQLPCSCVYGTPNVSTRRYLQGQLAAGLSGVLLYADVVMREFLSQSKLLEPRLREGSLKWVGLERAG